MVRYLIILAIIVSSFCLQAQTISISASTDTTDYLVGDFINYNIEVTAKKNIQVLDPIIPDTLSQLDLISVINPVRSESDESISTNYLFILAGYDSAAATIPSVAIEYRSEGDTLLKKITTDPITVNIHTVPVSTAEEIKDVKSPLTIAFDWIELMLWLALGLLVIIVGWILYKRYKKKKSEAPIEKKIIKIPVHVKALSALDELEGHKLWQQGKVKEYHSRITEIIRVYFEDRFDLPAMELPTTESLDQLRSIKEAKNITDLTFDFLSNADLVKFAKFQPLQSVNEEMMTQARDIIRETIPIADVRVEKEEVYV
ncbi:MAG: hypothetical protein JSW63_07540 [Ignavibacterium sp.]|nr:MAG: hypothetical protein JSW63_07540 [Ignavibacterium sp.]